MISYSMITEILNKFLRDRAKIGKIEYTFHIPTCTRDGYEGYEGYEGDEGTRGRGNEGTRGYP